MITDAAVGETINLFGGISYNSNVSAIGNQQYSVVRGNYNPGSSFVENAAGIAALIVWDADPTAGFSASAIVIQNLSGVATTNTSQIII